MCRELINNNQGYFVICNVMSGKYWVDCVSRISMKQARASDSECSVLLG